MSRSSRFLSLVIFVARFSFCDSFDNCNRRDTGYIDHSGKLVIATQFDTAYEFHDGLAAAEICHRWGYIDTVGRWVIQPKFRDAAREFSEGLAVVTVRTKQSRTRGFVDRSGFIDKTGKLIIPARFEEAGNFQEGLAPVQIGGKWGYIDKTGETVIAPEFLDAYGFSYGLARVRVSGDVMDGFGDS